MNLLVTTTVIAPILAAAAALLLRSHPKLRDVVTLVGIGLATLASYAMLIDVNANGSQTVRVGGWAPELGIVLVADLFAVLVLPIALSIILVVEIFAIGQRRTAWGANPELAGPLLGVLTGGVSLAILTGDLFTLFVAFELILVSSYVLLTHQGQRDQIRSGMTYVVMNLLASTLFLFGVAFVYAATGTINLALLAERIPSLTVVFGSASAPGSSWCLARRQRSSHYSLGFPTPTPRLRPRLRRCLPACSPKSASIR